jgi:hypothetical protein
MVLQNISKFLIISLTFRETVCKWQFRGNSTSCAFRIPSSTISPIHICYLTSRTQKDAKLFSLFYTILVTHFLGLSWLFIVSVYVGIGNISVACLCIRSNSSKPNKTWRHMETREWPFTSTCLPSYLLYKKEHFFRKLHINCMNSNHLTISIADWLLKII